MENSETIVWIDFSLNCGYINKNIADELNQKAEKIGKILNYMIQNPMKFIR